MLNILLVDDEIDILDGISAGVNFDSIGISGIYTATNADEARLILQSTNIDIMLTDIEMPVENGLDLLAWVRANDYDIVTLFCTSYADFNYAKKAVEMQSFDYFLKPISYAALEETLKCAAEEVKSRKSMQNYKKHSQYWLSCQKENKRDFWTGIIFSASSISEILSTSKENGLDYGENDSFTVCTLILIDDSVELPKWKIYGFRNIAEEIFARGGISPEAMIPFSDANWVLAIRETSDLKVEHLQDVLTQLIECANKYLDSSLNCYYSLGCNFNNIRDKNNFIKEVYVDDVISENVVCDATKYDLKTSGYSSEHINKWDLLLSTGKRDELVCTIEKYLYEMAEKDKVNFVFLRSLRLDLIQMLYILLSQKEINAHKLFVNERYDKLLANSLKSVKKFLQYIDCAYSIAFDYINFTQESQSVVGQVKQYINTHLGEEINRTAIASHVFLNPDYLARLFKKETGQSIGAYLQERRLHEAKKLLVQSSIPVNEIAQQVGYDNFSYFSHVFREKTGMSPNEYRKENNNQ